MKMSNGYGFGGFGTRDRRMGPGGKPRRSAEDKRCKVFVTALPRDTESEAVKGLFEGVAEVVDGYVIRDPKTKKSRGYAFIKLKSPDDVDTVMANRPYSIDDKELIVKRVLFSDRPENSVTSERIFVGGLKDHTEDDLLEYFGKFGNVTEIKMGKDKEGDKKDYASVIFDDYDAVDKAVDVRRHMCKGAQLRVRKFLDNEARQEVNKKKKADNFRKRTQMMMQQQMAAAAYGMDGGMGGGFGFGGGEDWGYGSFNESSVGGASGSKRRAIGDIIPNGSSGFGAFGGIGGAKAGGGVSAAGQKFAGKLRGNDVSDAGIEALMRENLLNPEILTSLTMTEFNSLPLSMGDKKRVQIVLSGMQ